ncbi:MAG: ABC transporter ATP-binding protein [Planctomycetota bacterium]
MPTQTDASPVIQTNGLSQSYGSFRALDGLTVSFPGGAMGLLGPNGAGKTTLLKVLLGFLRPDAGQATVLDLDAMISPLELRRRVGYMPETDCYIPGMKGVRFVAFAAEISGLPGRDALTRAHEVLYYVGLEEARYRKVDEYSQGMRQRLRLAQALAHDPDLLFLDEPTSGLDPGGRREMLDLVLDLSRDQGKHVVLSTHLLPDVEEVCSSVVVLDSGRMAASGSLAELRGMEKGRFEVRLKGDLKEVTRRLAERGCAAEPIDGDRLSVRLPDGPLVLFRAVKDAGAQVRELKEIASTLEEAFLAALETGEDA